MHANGDCLKANFSFDANLFPELSDFPSDIDSYEKLYDYSLNNYKHFWSVCARRRIQWFQDFNEVTNIRDFNAVDFNLKWFIGGKLNVSCIFTTWNSISFFN
jgi:hypothetical protein